MANITLPSVNFGGDDVWGQQLNDILTDINGDAETGKSQAATALSTANTAASTASAASAAVASKAADNAVVKLTGAQTVAGAKDFSTAPTVASVPVATTGDLAGYIPNASAATIDLTDIDVDGTGDMVVHAGGKLVTFSWVAGVLTGGTLDDGPPPSADYDANIKYRWVGAFGSASSLTPAKGGVTLTGDSDNAIVSDGGKTGVFLRGHTGALSGTLTTPVVAESTDGYTTFTWLIRHLHFSPVGIWPTNAYIASLGTTDFLAQLHSDDTMNFLVYNSNGNWTGNLDATASEVAPYTLPGDPTVRVGALGGSWKVLTLALKQSSAGKLILNGTTVITGINTDGIASISNFLMSAQSSGVPQNRGGFNTYEIDVATGMNDAKITALHTALLASVA